MEEHQAVGKRGVQLQERDEGVVAEARAHPPFHHLHADLDCGFIPGTGGAGRDDGHARGLRECGVGPGEGRLVTMGPAHGSLQGDRIVLTILPPL